jgi:hypothetical protein
VTFPAFLEHSPQVVKAYLPANFFMHGLRKQTVAGGFFVRYDMKLEYSSD